MARRTGYASEVDLDAQGDWQLVTDGAHVEVVQAPALAGFMPATPGDVWEYRSTQEGAPPLHSRERIVSASQRGGLWVARMCSEVDELAAALSERDLVIAAAGVLPDIGTMTSGSGPVYTRETRGLYLPHALPVGLRWTWAQQLEMPGATLEVTGNAEVVAIERVTVPAGSFEAVRVHGEIFSRVQLHAPAGSPPLESVQRDASHWVRGLGLVQNIGLGPPDPQRAKVLVAYDVRGAPPRRGG